MEGIFAASVRCPGDRNDLDDAGKDVCVAAQLVGDTLLRSLCVFWDNFPGLRRQL